MKKIFLIEDNEALHTEIRAEISCRSYKEEVEIFPRYFGDNQLTYEYNGYLLGKILEGETNFTSILDYYNKIDLFIIDVSLSANDSSSGLKFCKFVIGNYIGNYKIIIISNNPHRDNVLNNSKVIFISKYDTTRAFFVKDLVNKIEVILKFKEDEEQSLKGLLGNLRDSFTQRKVILDVKAPSTPTVHTNPLYISHQLWIYLRDNTDKFIDKLVFLLFYMLLLCTLFYAGSKIINDILKSFENQSTTQLLTVAEHMFLALLPIYIVLGFFKYYRINLRISLLGAANTPLDEEASTKTMNLTKKLFVSSIISYTIIEILLEVFENNEKDLKTLIAYAIFLVILMVYYLLIEKIKHKE